MKKKTKIYICAIMGIGLLCNAATAEEFTVVDGDSLSRDEQRIRLDGIDAPETTQTCLTASGQEYACGQRAGQYLNELIADSEVRCDCLPETDIYKRLICECFVDEISINSAMVQAGHAMTYRSEKYLKEEQSAKQGKRGIWQGKFMRPALYRALERAREN